MSFYSSMQDMATRLITDYGQSYTFTRVTSGAYNPSTATSPTSESTFNGVAVQLDYKNVEIDGERILQTDKKVVCNAMDTPPEVNDFINMGSERYKVMNVKTVSPAGTVLTYELQVRL